MFFFGGGHSREARGIRLRPSDCTYPARELISICTDTILVHKHTGDYWTDVRTPHDPGQPQDPGIQSHRASSDGRFPSSEGKI